MIVWIVLAVIAAFIVLYVIATYNSLVGLRNRVNDQWSQIDVVFYLFYCLSYRTFTNAVVRRYFFQSQIIEKIIFENQLITVWWA